MSHTLLITALVDHQIAAILFQRLAQPQHVAMSENGEDAFYELRLNAININELIIKKFNQRLCRGQSDSAHILPYMLVDPDFRDSTPGVVIGGKGDLNN